MATVNTYLTFDGTCEEAFNFYKSIFGGEFSFFGRFEDMPESDDYKVPKADKTKIMHVSLPIGTSVLMGSDVGGDWGPALIQGNNFSVSVAPESKEEADAIFSALSEDGKITTPIHNTFWGAYFGMLTDRFGIQWMVNFEHREQQ